jgi:ribosomal-protein-alanine N-acetyltransferase
MIINKIKVRDNIFAEYINTDLFDPEKYLKWLSDKESNPFIMATSQEWNREKLLKYINEQNDSETTALIGIFDTSLNNHIGNIKFENVYFRSLNCSLGILIGEPEYRGVGVGTAVLSETIKFISSEFEIFEFFLGVDKKNINAINTYTKLGFRIVKNSEVGDTLRMTLRF